MVPIDDVSKSLDDRCENLTCFSSQQDSAVSSQQSPSQVGRKCYNMPQSPCILRSLKVSSECMTVERGKKKIRSNLFSLMPNF